MDWKTFFRVFVSLNVLAIVFCYYAYFSSDDASTRMMTEIDDLQAVTSFGGYDKSSERAAANKTKKSKGKKAKKASETVLNLENNNSSKLEIDLVNAPSTHGKVKKGKKASKDTQNNNSTKLDVDLQNAAKTKTKKGKKASKDLKNSNSTKLDIDLTEKKNKTQPLFDLTNNKHPSLDIVVGNSTTNGTAGAKKAKKVKKAAMDLENNNSTKLEIDLQNAATTGKTKMGKKASKDLQNNDSAKLTVDLSLSEGSSTNSTTGTGKKTKKGKKKAKKAAEL